MCMSAAGAALLNAETTGAEAIVGSLAPANAFQSQKLTLHALPCKFDLSDGSNTHMLPGLENIVGRRSCMVSEGDGMHV